MHIEKVIEPAVNALGRSVGVTAQSAPHAIFRFRASNPVSLCADAHRGKTESRHAGAAACLVTLAGIVLRDAVDQIATDSSLRIHRVLKIAETALGQILQQSVIVVAAREPEGAPRGGCCRKRCRAVEKAAAVELLPRVIHLSIRPAEFAWAMIWMIDSSARLK